jgi:hypothetical protein
MVPIDAHHRGSALTIPRCTSRTETAGAFSPSGINSSYSSHPA